MRFARLLALQVRTAEHDKWQDVEYLNHTSLKTYMPYMMGGGYVLSADLARVILGINRQVTSIPRRTTSLRYKPNCSVLSAAHSFVCHQLPP